MRPKHSCERQGPDPLHGPWSPQHHSEVGTPDPNDNVLLALHGILENLIQCVHLIPMENIGLGLLLAIAITPTNQSASPPPHICLRCPRKMIPPCQSSTCQNGGFCHDRWSHSVCECKSPYTGSHCATGKSAPRCIYRSSTIPSALWVLYNMSRFSFAKQKYQRT